MHAHDRFETGAVAVCEAVKQFAPARYLRPPIAQRSPHHRAAQRLCCHAAIISQRVI